MKALRTCFFLLAGALLAGPACAQSGKKTASPYQTASYYDSPVPDSASAVRTAEVVWLTIYGKSVNRKRPFRAVLLHDSIWVVKGSLPAGWKGGVPYIEISRRSGRIREVTHGR